jgi:hypothetical protein
LLDFLVGDSVEKLARKNRLPHEHVEQALRTALSSYGFHAERKRGSGDARTRTTA